MLLHRGRVVNNNYPVSIPADGFAEDNETKYISEASGPASTLVILKYRCLLPEACQIQVLAIVPRIQFLG
jgi:hypothetical protein